MPSVPFWSTSNSKITPPSAGCTITLPGPFGVLDAPSAAPCAKQKQPSKATARFSRRNIVNNQEFRIFEDNPFFGELRREQSGRVPDVQRWRNGCVISLSSLCNVPGTSWLASGTFIGIADRKTAALLPAQFVEDLQQGTVREGRWRQS